MSSSSREEGEEGARLGDMKGATVTKDSFHVNLVKIELFKINVSALECLVATLLSVS